MKFTITVLAYNNGYIKDYQYSQGYLDEIIVSSPLQAEDYSDPDKLQTALMFYKDKGAVVEKYEVEYKKI